MESKLQLLMKRQNKIPQITIAKNNMSTLIFACVSIVDSLADRVGRKERKALTLF